MLDSPCMATYELSDHMRKKIHHGGLPTPIPIGPAMPRNTQLTLRRNHSTHLEMKEMILILDMKRGIRHQMNQRTLPFDHRLPLMATRAHLRLPEILNELQTPLLKEF